MIITTGQSRRATTWRPESIEWNDLVKRLQQVTRTQETTAEYAAMTKAERGEVKDVGGFVGGELVGERRTRGAVKSRHLITLDIDNGAANTLDAIREALSGLAWLVYSTHSHTETAPRYRLILPLAYPVAPDEYEATARAIAGAIDIQLFDGTTFEPHRLMYWPSCSRDAEPVFVREPGAPVDAAAWLATYDDWRDPSSWPRPAGELAAPARTLKKKGDPRKASGWRGLFNRAYTISDAIEQFLPWAYEEVGQTASGDRRYTFVGGSTVGGAVTYDGDAFLYSHHSTDPAAGQLLGAFDLVRVHLYGDLDPVEIEAGKTPPSVVQMTKLAQTDARVVELRSLEFVAEMDGAGLAYAAPATASGKDIAEVLADITKGAAGGVDKSGNVIQCIANILYILKNDKALVGALALDEFSGRACVVGPVPWRRISDAKEWTDDDAAKLRNYLNIYYGINSPRLVRDALATIFSEHMFHPIRDYLKAQAWDGTPRVDTLFIDYLGAEDSDYTRAAARKWLAGAVARVMEPGCKFDYAIVLCGPQGIGKTLLLERLGGPWFTNSLQGVTGKDSKAIIHSAWLIELGEMAPTLKSEVEELKQFITTRVDTYRPPYKEFEVTKPRQCVFAGTTNNLLFLKDRTGNRRFWPIVCNDDNRRKTVWADLTAEEVGQIWAEAVTIYDAGEPLTLNIEEEEALLEAQEPHTEGQERAALIMEYLDRWVPRDFDKKNINERLQYNEFYTPPERDDIAEAAGLERRSIVCAMEVACEALGMARKDVRPRDIREISDILQNAPGWKRYDGNKSGKARRGPYGVVVSFIRK